MRVRAIDAGGSMTRIARREDDIIVAPSECMEIPVNSTNKTEDINNKYLDFIIKRCPYEELSNRRFVKAEAMNQYKGERFVCDNQKMKVLQEITYINTLYAIANDCIQRGINDDEFRIGVCIPAAEYYDDDNERVDSLKDKLEGETSIYFPLLDTTINFRISRRNIGVVAEGVVAAFKYKNDRDFVTRKCVIIDIGYRSTEIVILDGFQPVGSGAASRPIGGINLEASILAQLERDNIFVSTDVIQKSLTTVYVVDASKNSMTDITEYVRAAERRTEGDLIDCIMQQTIKANYAFTRDEISRAVKSFYITQGASVVDITEYVHAAKELFADAVHRAVLAVANAQMMNIGDISGALCVGRPFSGNLNDEFNLMNLLKDKFKGQLDMYAVPDAGCANVVEIIKLLGQEENDVRDDLQNT